jgi:hypothetical protein
MKRRLVLSVPLVLGMLGTTLAIQPASATHPRPKGATPIRVPFVPAYKACATPNRTHGAPLAFPSCNPPEQVSPNLTIGSPDANGATANAIGFAKVEVVAGVPGPPDDSDVKLSGQATDIRCKPGVAACGSANSQDGPDYTGELQSNAIIRVTDHYNGPGLNEAATMQDLPFPTNVTCGQTASTAIGGFCSVATTANAIVPGAIKDGQRAIVESGQIFASDGGVDGLVSTADNSTFAVQGVFIP